MFRSGTVLLKCAALSCFAAMNAEAANDMASLQSVMDADEGISLLQRSLSKTYADLPGDHHAHAKKHKGEADSQTLVSVHDANGKSTHKSEDEIQSEAKAHESFDSTLAEIKHKVGEVALQIKHKAEETKEASHAINEMQSAFWKLQAALPTTHASHAKDGK